VALQRMLQDEPLLAGADARAAALKREIAATVAGSACRDRLIQEAKNLCPGERPQELAPELVIVFDASGSMNYSLLATPEDIQIAQHLEELVARDPSGLLKAMMGAPQDRVFREPRRITSAKEAATTVVRKAPSDANIGLVMIEDCPAARSAGFFPPANRAALLSLIGSIQPVRGTPLADGVRRGGLMLDGVQRESIMLVVSDGVEGCGQDPCAIAKALARDKPHLRINVVDIMGTGAGNCLAEATRGKVYTARNASEIELMTSQAAADAMAPADCTPR
jgi:hypothetical protein